MNSNSTSNRQIRIFGLVAFLFFGILSTIGYFAGKWIPLYLFGVLSLLGIFFIIIPAQMKPVYHSWLKVAHFIGKVITTIVLTIAYYFVITPSGFLKRLISGPVLPLPSEGSDTTYWVTRDEPFQSKERFLKRY